MNSGIDGMVATTEITMGESKSGLYKRLLGLLIRELVLGLTMGFTELAFIPQTEFKTLAMGCMPTVRAFIRDRTVSDGGF
jgi:hypothetical protein